MKTFTFSSQIVACVVFASFWQLALGQHVYVSYTDLSSPSDSIRLYAADGSLINESEFDSRYVPQHGMVPWGRNLLLGLFDRERHSPVGDKTVYEVSPSAVPLGMHIDPWFRGWLSRDSNGNIYGSNSFGVVGVEDDQVVKRWNAQGELTLETTSEQLRGGQAIASDGGRIYSAGSRVTGIYHTNQLTQFSPTGEVEATHPLHENNDPGQPNFFSGDIAYDASDARLYVSSQRGAMQVFDVAGEEPVYLTQFDVPLLSSGIFDIYVDPFSDRLYAAGLSGAVELTKSGDLIQHYPAIAAQGVMPASALVAASDVNGDFTFDLDDIDAVVTAVANGSDDLSFDLTGDGVVDHADISQWLADAGLVNQANAQPFLPGDANLDGNVDVGDFNIWNGNRFTFQTGWSRGDFNADGVIDTADFGIWNEHKFLTSDTTPVPEPSCRVWLVGMLLFVASCSFPGGRRSRRFSALRGGAS
ncbi:MAG: hypothetical protein AAF385_17040 [Pseudomonadota bacterium]